MPSKSTGASSPDIQLRAVIASDLPILFEHQADREASRMAAFPSRDREAFMSHWAKLLADETKVVRAILLQGEVVGNVGSWVSEGSRRVGYWIGRAHWGRGIATRALAEFLKEIPERPVQAFVAKENIGSIRVLEKCGFSLCRLETEGREPPRDGVEELVSYFERNNIRSP
ncbi:MAG TPA: GNAT family N-acetyltransferase, partial [Gemmata sp.]|nr:GNAT family N-acetyltransferase [Gemmata sp.]